jgi:hypothetical protein
MSDVIYLYGMVPATAPSPPGELRGLADAAVESIAVGTATAVVSRLPAAAFAPDLMEAHMQDLAWVGEQGLAHERVVLWYVDEAEILPARLFTLYSDERALRAALEPQQQRITRSLTALAGRREWNLKVAYDSAELGRHGALVSARIEQMDRDIAAAAPGRRYLLQRKRADALKQEVSAAARRLAGELLDVLGAHAERVHVLPLAAGEDAGTVVLHAALLVVRDREAALRAEAERLAEDQQRVGMIVTFSGPWAAYRFMEDAGE